MLPRWGFFKTISSHQLGIELWQSKKSHKQTAFPMDPRWFETRRGRKWRDGVGEHYNLQNRFILLHCNPVNLLIM